MMDVWCDGCGQYFEKITVGVKANVDPVNRIVRRGDRYICKSCGVCIISDFGTPYDERLPQPYEERWKK